MITDKEAAVPPPGRTGEEGLSAQEADLLAAARTGDKQAFDTLIDLHAVKVASVVRHFLPPAGERDDAVQETFVRAYERLHQFRGDAGLRTWLLKIAINICRQRRGGFWQRRVHLASSIALDRLDGGNAQTLAESALLNSERQQEILRALAALPDNFRLPIVLHYFENLTGAEIAALLGWNESTVWSRLYAGLRKLRQSLSRYENA